eukprot:m.315900 g.315900  ORF g.315900 m.315900 type:complete len:95 (-) comp20282_c0_seq6:1170-1454(-)
MFTLCKDGNERGMNYVMEFAAASNYPRRLEYRLVTTGRKRHGAQTESLHISFQMQPCGVAGSSPLYSRPQNSTAYATILAHTDVHCWIVSIFEL